MTPEEKNPNVDGRTTRGARTSLAKRQISQESYRAVLRGELSLADAKALGRNRGPDIHASQKVQETPAKPQPVVLCWCGCGQEVRPGRRWRQGHDAIGKSKILRAVAEGTMEELPETLREYGIERGLI